MTPTQLLESALEGEFRRLVAGIGGLILKLAPTERGIPDRLVILPGGRMFLVELKVQNRKPSPIQRVMHERMLRRGITVHVLNGSEDVRAWVREQADLSWQGDFDYVDEA